jgi:phosphoserine phosphatase
LPVSTVYQLISEIRYQENAGRVINTLKEWGIYTVIISSGLSLLVNRVKEDLSLDMAVSNELVSRGGILTGGIKINVEYDRKGPIVTEILGSLGLQKEEASAVGDGDGDGGMFEAVALPIGLVADESSRACLSRTRLASHFDDVVRLIREYP